MKLLHTADWHLGAYLGPYSRIAEQRLFLANLCRIVDERQVDMVLIAGDVFDTANPSAAAEGLFYSAMADLAQRKIPIVVVAGNHDSAERLLAPIPMASELGVLVFATPHCRPITRDYGNFAVHSPESACVEITFKTSGERAVLAALPFVSEKRLGEAIFDENTIKSEAAMQQDYSAKIGALFARAAAIFRQDVISIAAGHFHIAGGESSRGAERDILLGGSFAVHPRDMPDAQYIAMGHLHRSQKVKCGPNGDNLAYYAGSPLPYSLSEQGYPKAVYIADLAAGRPAAVEKVLLDCPKAIELWEVKTAADALLRCAEPSNAYKYIRITDEATLSPHDIKEMRRLAADIVAIDITAGNDAVLTNLDADFAKLLDPREEFANFYAKTHGIQPKPEVLQIFSEILLSTDDEDEQ